VADAPFHLRWAGLPARVLCARLVDLELDGRLPPDLRRLLTDHRSRLWSATHAHESVRDTDTIARYRSEALELLELWSDHLEVARG
jgi:hypothetical protein